MIVAEGKIVAMVVHLRPWLQWGRNMIVAEGSVWCVWYGSLAGLQWGRNMIVAEGVKRASSTLS